MKILFLTCCCLLMASPALAAAPDKFPLMDADKNGSIAWEEFHTTYPQMRREAFDSIDADKDQAISRQEWDTFRARHSQGRSGMGMPPAAAPDQQGKKPLILPPKP